MINRRERVGKRGKEKGRVGYMKVVKREREGDWRLRISI